MEDKVLLFLDLLNPEAIIQYGGLFLLIAIIFAETGLFFGFFLPGDSLLFVAGLLSDSEYLDAPVSFLIPVLIVAAVAGSTVGYFTGKFAGKYLQNRKENLFYRKKYLDMTHNFYERFGLLTFILGRFLPIIRTFATILAGVARINFIKFSIFNIIGVTIWVVIMVMSGYWLGNIFPGIVNHLEMIVVGMILFSALPVLLFYMRNSIKTIKGKAI